MMCATELSLVHKSKTTMNLLTFGKEVKLYKKGDEKRAVKNYKSKKDK